MGTNPTRNCTGCGQVDDHPRHAIYTGDPATPWTEWHKDCHANSGCEVCKEELEAIQGYEPGIVGEEFRQLILAHYASLQEEGQ